MQALDLPAETSNILLKGEGLSMPAGNARPTCGS